MNKRRLGGYYEDAAGDYLVKNGLTILDKNVRCGRLGESIRLQLVMIPLYLWRLSAEVVTSSVRECMP